MKASVPLVLSVLILTGCTGLEPAAIGAGVSVVKTGVTYISGVNSYSFQPAVYGDVFIAAVRAGDRLGLELYSDRKVSETKHELKYTFGGQAEDRLVVHIERETDSVTYVEVNVKKKSKRGMATLYLRMLTNSLSEQGAYDWDVDESSVPLDG